MKHGILPKMHDSRVTQAFFYFEEITILISFGPGASRVFSIDNNTVFKIHIP